MVDDFARQGYYTYLVDYLNGDAIAPDALNSGNVSRYSTYARMRVISSLCECLVRPSRMARQPRRRSDARCFGPGYGRLEGGRRLQVRCCWLLLRCTYSHIHWTPPENVELTALAVV